MMGKNLPRPRPGRSRSPRLLNSKGVPHLNIHASMPEGDELQGIVEQSGSGYNPTTFGNRPSGSPDLQGVLRAASNVRRLKRATKNISLSV